MEHGTQNIKHKTQNFNMIHLFKKFYFHSVLQHNSPTKENKKTKVFTPPSVDGGLLTLFLFAFCFVATAQNKNEQKYALMSNSSVLGVSVLNLADPYLSPLTYSGFGVRFDGDSRKYLNPDNINLSWNQRINFVLGMGLNPAYSSSMVYMAANGGLGVHYHFRPLKGLQLLAGGVWDIDFGMKQIGRNVNNPYSVDLSTNLNLSGVALYDIPLRKRTLSLSGSVESPLLGCMFVPRSGASYYEMFDLWNLESTMHFSSLHNKRGFTETLAVDVPFNRSTWRFGIRISNLKYQANDMVFKRNEAALLIGIKYDVAIFSGKKNSVPVNFISTDN